MALGEQIAKPFQWRSPAPTSPIYATTPSPSPMPLNPRYLTELQFCTRDAPPLRVGSDRNSGKKGDSIRRLHGLRREQCANAVRFAKRSEPVKGGHCLGQRGPGCPFVALHSLG